MELILAQLARRSLRIATRAGRTLAYSIERGDHEGVASARAGLAAARGIARATVHRLHQLVTDGAIGAQAAAEIGLVLVDVLRVVEAGHPDGVMAMPSAPPYHRSDVAETWNEAESLQCVRTFGAWPSIRMRSDG